MQRGFEADIQLFYCFFSSLKFQSFGRSELHCVLQSFHKVFLTMNIELSSK
jgi:hypothetical protein